MVGGQHTAAVGNLLGALDLDAKPPFDRWTHQSRLEEAVPRGHGILLGLELPAPL
ncbi:hypothetical protein SDC9_116434 [bioreactor metagenome]|uniref:Uncharacterized protein n=1 Tax=bioreactor metagenome TaxID=1076179 RepID=A0A645BVP5_9ZZZZ